MQRYKQIHQNDFHLNRLKIKKQAIFIACFFILLLIKRIACQWEKQQI